MVDGAKTEKPSHDILDLLPSDPFGMNLSPVAANTGWNIIQSFAIKMVDGAKTEKPSDDILDLLPSDPFGMNLSPVAANTGWNEDLKEDFGFDILGFGTDESEVSEEDVQLLAGLNLDSNGSVCSNSEQSDLISETTTAGSCDSWVYITLFERVDDYQEDKTEHLSDDILDLLPSDPFGMNINGHQVDKTEHVSDDILDLLTSDPFGMNINAPKITCWIEDLDEEDFGLKILGFGTDESEVEEDCDQDFPPYSVIDVIADVLELSMDEVMKYF